MTTPRPRSRTKRQPASQRRPRRAPTPARGWQQHKTKARHVGRKFRQQSKSIGATSRRMAKRKGAVYGLAALAVASVAFTLAVTGALSEVAAFELGLASEGATFAAGWIIGDLRKPADQSKLKRTAAAAKARATLCGAPTVDGTPCRNRGKCPHHRGGGSTASKTKAAPTTASKAKTRPPRQTQTTRNQGVPGTTRSTVGNP
jgi:hypothetical protein